ncbi:MAG: beta-N-acetylhexosaminidase [Caldilineales bacterium]
MALEQKVGQVMCAGFEGSDLTPSLRLLLEELHLGGLVYFERNVASRPALARLSTDLQQAARQSGHPALLIATDQEGGRVTRLRAAKGFREFPSPLELAAAGGSDAVRQAALVMAAELMDVGINVNLAPVLDTCGNNPDNPVINTRSFGSDPHLVAACGVAMIEGLQGAGIMAVGKHFPGHGDTTVDSHVALPVVAHSRDRLEAVEFVPFRAAMAAGVAGIMSAHVHFPVIESASNLPATLSRRVMTDLLRHEMGYDGLAMTDSLEMGALATSGYPAPLAAAHALAAGADVLLFNTGYDVLREVHSLIVRWVEEGKLDPARLDDAVLRVLTTKQRFGLL